MAVGFTHYESIDRSSDPRATDLTGDQLTGLSTADACMLQGFKPWLSDSTPALNPLIGVRIPVRQIVASYFKAVAT